MPVPAPGSLDAREFLSGVADVAAGRSAASPRSSPLDSDVIADWLRRSRLSAAAYPFLRKHHSDLAARLRPDALAAAASNLARFRALDAIDQAFGAAGIPVVLLKGAAVARSSYADPSLRPMTDIDLWSRDEDFARACGVLERLGYRETAGNRDRPKELQRRCGGEIVFEPAETKGGLVELHYSAFQGSWVRRAAQVDDESVWRRALPVAAGQHARRLAPEDAILQTAFHVVVNQFSQAPLRGMLDIAVMARAHDVDWKTIEDRARGWRLATAVGVVLELADTLFRLPGAGRAVEALAPRGLRRAALRRFVTADALLAGCDLTRSASRYPLLLALTDQPRDAARVVSRTLWPEALWRQARYGRPRGPVGHIWSLVRRGAV